MAHCEWKSEDLESATRHSVCCRASAVKMSAYVRSYRHSHAEGCCLRDACAWLERERGGSAPFDDTLGFPVGEALWDVFVEGESVSGARNETAAAIELTL
mmetsp:Transcript_12581/g.33897  ORF Transcript_12581/g.33897 Transcript_12581/m.33897 type:complete len:100 (+) Transcript_12581:65-364(+)